MKYEITTPGRNDSRICMNASCSSLAAARTLAQRLAASENKPMLIERVAKSGNSTIIERVAAR